jgi:hypothetical protein
VCPSLHRDAIKRSAIVRTPISYGASAFLHRVLARSTDAAVARMPVSAHSCTSHPSHAASLAHPVRGSDAPCSPAAGNGPANPPGNAIRRGRRRHLVRKTLLYNTLRDISRQELLLLWQLCNIRILNTAIGGNRRLIFHK